MISLKEILNIHDDALNNLCVFKSILYYYYDNSSTIEILSSIYDCGIYKEIIYKKKYSELDILEYNKFLIRKYGFSKNDIEKHLKMWVDIVNDDSTIKQKVAKEQEEAKEFRIEVVNNEVYIKKFVGFERDYITIPNKISNLPVRRICANAFQKCSQIKEIIISEGIKEIEFAAFAKCENLRKVSFPYSLVSFGIFNGNTFNPEETGVFRDTLVRNIEFKHGLKVIYDGAFSKCVNIETIYIPSTVCGIGSCAFYECKSLREVRMPNNIDEIYNKTFYNCSSLKEVILSENIVKLGVSAFEGCANLKKIKLPQSLNKISKCAFKNCGELSVVLTNKTLYAIDENAFLNCNKLTHIILPETLSIIENNAFDKNISIGCYSGSYALEFARENNYKYFNAET